MHACLKNWEESASSSQSRESGEPGMFSARRFFGNMSGRRPASAAGANPASPTPENTCACAREHTLQLIIQIPQAEQGAKTLPETVADGCQPRHRPHRGLVVDDEGRRHGAWRELRARRAPTATAASAQPRRRLTPAWRASFDITVNTDADNQYVGPTLRFLVEPIWPGALTWSSATGRSPACPASLPSAARAPGAGSTAAVLGYISTRWPGKPA